MLAPALISQHSRSETFSQSAHGDLRIHSYNEDKSLDNTGEYPDHITINVFFHFFIVSYSFHITSICDIDI